MGEFPQGDSFVFSFLMVTSPGNCTPLGHLHGTSLLLCALWSAGMGSAWVLVMVLLSGAEKSSALKMSF